MAEFYKSYKIKCNYLKKLTYMKYLRRKTEAGNLGKSLKD